MATLSGADLDALPDIGVDLAGKIADIVATGTCDQLERLHEEVPPAITGLLGIPRLGPKRVRALHQGLGIKTLADLLRAARLHRIRTVQGFGRRWNGRSSRQRRRGWRTSAASDCLSRWKWPTRCSRS